MQFFGKTVSDTGCEILVKTKTRFVDPGHPGHQESWRDGQIVEITPLGFHTATFVGYCLLLIELPNVDYLSIGGRTEAGWKILPGTPTIWDKINHTVDINGKHKWEKPKQWEFKSKRKTRDYFIDLKHLEQQGHITESEREQAYNHGTKTILNVPSVMSITSILRHEDSHTRIDPSWLLEHASITSGTHSIGSGLDYDTVTAFEAAIGATMTANLTGEHANEESAISTSIAFDTDTAGFLLKLTAVAGAEHNGGAYGNGARINMGSFDAIRFAQSTGGTLDDTEMSNLAIDISGSSNFIRAEDGGDAGMMTFNRLRIQGDSSSAWGISCLSNAINVDLRNNIISGIGDGGSDSGIRFFNITSTLTYTCYNNTCIGNYTNFNQDSTTLAGTLTFKNNIAQADSGNVDYQDDGGGFGTSAINVSEDATSPDASYQSKDLHTNTIFNGYGTNDFTLDSAGDATNLAIVDDGEDLSGVFTDDIIGQTRSTWYAGASEIVAAPAAGGPVVGSLSLMGVGI